MIFQDLTDSDGEISNYYLPSSLTPQSLSQEVVSPILDEVLNQVFKSSEDSRESICKKSELKKNLDTTNNEGNTNTLLSMFSLNILTRKPKICLTPLSQTNKPKFPLVPYLIDDDSDTSTIRTSQDEEQSGEDNPNVNKQSQFSCENTAVKRKPGRKRKSDITIPQLPVDVSTGNDSSNSASSSADDFGKGKRKRFKNVRMLDIEEVVKKSPSRKK